MYDLCFPSSLILFWRAYTSSEKEFAYRGCYFLKPGKELDAVRKTIIINGALNSKIPGKSAYEIAKLAGVKCSGRYKNPYR